MLQLYLAHHSKYATLHQHLHITTVMLPPSMLYYIHVFHLSNGQQAVAIAQQLIASG